MKKTNQSRVLGLLTSKRYIVKDDQVLSFYRGKYMPLKGTIFDSGYRQVQLHGANFIVAAYVHQIVYLANFGEYDENLEIDHLDKNPMNNYPNNLKAKTSKDNCQNSIGRQPNNKGILTIRDVQIKQIRELHSNGLSQSAIARRLGLNRLSVRYIIKKIDSNIPLKYEKKNQFSFPL